MDYLNQPNTIIKRKIFVDDENKFEQTYSCMLEDKKRYDVKIRSLFNIFLASVFYSIPIFSNCYDNIINYV